MPLEIMIDTKRKKRLKLFYSRRMDELEEAIDEIPELSKPISIVNLVKYSSKRTTTENQNTMIYPLQESPLSCPTQKMRPKIQRTT
jgi:hypothetical protein